MISYVLVAAIATWQIVEIWNHSLLLSGLHSRVELWDNKIGELLICPFCFSNWVSLCCVCFLQLSVEGIHGLNLSTIVCAFAAARLANLGNDYFKKITLTPKVTFYDYESEGESGFSE